MRPARWRRFAERSAWAAYANPLHTAGVAISMAKVGQVAQNAHIELLIRAFKGEEVDLSDYLRVRGQWPAHQVAGTTINQETPFMCPILGARRDL